MRWGLLFVGIQGASASTLAASLSRENDDTFRVGSYWCTLAGDYPKQVYDLVLGGWDYRHHTFHEAVQQNAILNADATDEERITAFPAVLGPSDYAVRVEKHTPTHETYEDAVVCLRRDIASFRDKNSLHHVIVMNMSSPMYCGPSIEAGWSSIPAYAKAAVEEGADWVEFTPSDSITENLVQLAKRSGSRIAGRDGSTGQTILKLVLRDFLQDRGLRIETWYSTNLIGNRDGLVLSHDDYKVTKLRDKTSVLPESHEGAKRHLVEIQFVPPTGDNKESWDCVYFLGWLNTRMSLRINWHGADSFLAAPLMLDIISGLIHADHIGHPPGVVSALGLCFKSPFGVESYRFDELYSDFKKFVARRTGEDE